MIFLLQYITLFGNTYSSYSLTNWFNYIIVLIITILIRRRYNCNFIKALFVGLLTLAFGVFALHATSNLEYDIMNILVKDGAFERYELTSSYGYWVFMSPLYLLFCAIFCVDFRKLTDYVTPSICIVASLGKLACFLDGCCEGPKDPNGIYMAKLGYKVFPVQLYETLLYGAVFILALVLTFTFSKKRTGYLMPISGMLYAVFKIWAEQYRTWPSELTNNFLNTGHNYWEYFELFSFIGCLIWLIGVIICDKKGKHPKFETNAFMRKVWKIKEELLTKLQNKFPKLKGKISKD
ncbi:MAG: hypothetical protein E7570_06575 [Ruminococcaceae bacterium]|jgi:uncharacterized membrane protein HdeD (DUF308 family)|nr:hypothetical protein [Oscillospiraceae bacterium]